MLSLKTQNDLQTLCDERAPETLTLEFKGSGALQKDDASRRELVKDVTAMANSAGGQIVYGVAEDRAAGVADALDAGCDRAVISPEWIGQVLDSNVSPRLQGVEIHSIPLNGNEGQIAYVIDVPQAVAFAPHQNSIDKKYYKRVQTRAIPMEDYEIRDVLKRSVSPLLDTTMQARASRQNYFGDGTTLAMYGAFIRLRNLSQRSARFPYVSVRSGRFEPDYDGIEKGIAAQVLDGWVMFSAGADIVIHPGQSRIIAALKTSIRVPSNNTVAASTLRPGMFDIDIQFGSLDAAVAEKTHIVKIELMADVGGFVLDPHS